MKTRIVGTVLLVSLIVLCVPGQQRFRSGILFYHSTGYCIWGPNGGTVSVPDEVTKYNAAHGLKGADSVKLSGGWWPDVVDNEWYIWHDLFENPDTLNDIRKFLPKFPIIIIKSCFPSSNISGVGSISDTLTPTVKSVTNYKWHWRSIIAVMKAHPANFFVIWTNTPQVGSNTTDDEARLSDQFCRWAKDTLSRGLDPLLRPFPSNVYVFDFYHKLAGTDGRLPLQYATGPSDSHPNAVATALVAPQLVTEVFDAALAYESPTPTGIPNFLAFGNAVTGYSVSHSFQVLNSSINTLRIDSVYTQTHSFGAAVNKHFADSGDTIVVTVSLLPNRYGTFIDTLFIRNNSQSALVKVPLSASCPIPTFICLKTSVAFGNVAKNTTKKDTVKVSNASINSLTIDSIYTKSIAFTVDRVSGKVGTDSLKVVVSFTPTAIASYTDTVYFRNNSATPLVKMPLSGNGALTGVERIQTELPAMFSLAQNYPNPFNPSTIIRFQLPHASKVSLKVYNVLGQEAVTLMDEEKSAGVYEVNFNAVNLSSGMYVYRIQAGDFVATKKLVLLK